MATDKFRLLNVHFFEHKKSLKFEVKTYFKKGIKVKK